jgi:hypothetical protein
MLWYALKTLIPASKLIKLQTKIYTIMGLATAIAMNVMTL